MSKTIIKFFSVIFSGLLAGALLIIMLGYDSTKFSYTTYVEFQQGAINSLNTVMPIVGLITIIITIGFAAQEKSNRANLFMIIVAVSCLIVSGLITRFGNQPINAKVLTWSFSINPGDWMELRDKWLSFHKIRTFLSLIAFCLIAFVALKNNHINSTRHSL